MVTSWSAALVGEHEELRAEDPIGEALEAPSIAAAERVLGGERLHRLDAADRVDLAGRVAAVRLLEVVVERDGAASTRSASGPT